MNEVIDAPFPHMVAVDLFDEDLLARVADECIAAVHAGVGWRRYGNDHELKLEGRSNLWGPATCDYFDEVAAFAPTLGAAFGVPDATMETIGGGYHAIPPGGYLDVHTDFSRSPDSGLYRRLNVLTYLNESWEDPGGWLELWDDNGVAVKIAPEMGTTVVFATSATSWHGHPKPANRWRLSVAAYLFSPEPAPGFVDQSTVFHPNGGQRA